MYKLRINPLATEDLIRIKEYIMELESPTAAINVISKIIQSYEQLKEFPMLGIDLSSKIDVKTDFRYLVSGNYLVFYKVDAVYVSIYRILDARRNYLKILFPDDVKEV